MESKNHEIVSSELVFKFCYLNIILNLCKCLSGNNVCVFLRDEILNQMRKSEKKTIFHSNSISFGQEKLRGRCYKKCRQRLTLWKHFLKHFLLPTAKSIVWSNKNFRKRSTELTIKRDGIRVTKRLFSSNGNKEYYLGISQSTVYESYHIFLIRRDLKVQPPMVTFFQLTLPAARALLSRLPVALVAADNLHKSCFATEFTTIPLESTTTDMVWRVYKKRFYGNAVVTSLFK